MRFAEATMWIVARSSEEERVLNDETVSPGFLGFGVFLLLVAATYFLVRSMNKQLRKVPPTFDGQGDARRAGATPTEITGSPDGDEDPEPGDDSGRPSSSA